MSTFYDIFVGNNISPEFVRTFNAKWHRNANMHDAWISEPEKGTGYSTTYDTTDYHLLVIGQFYEHVDMKVLLENCVKYAKAITNIFEEPAGHYVMFLYDKLSKRYHVFTNRLGTYHVYYLSEGTQKAISTYYLGLAKGKSNKQLDWEGITGFMANGFFPGNTTYLEGISILEPASHYVFDENLELISNKRYWEWNYEAVDRPVDDLMEEFDTILSTSIKFATTDKAVGLPVSGGLDSRTLAGIITSHEMPLKSLWSYSYGYDTKSIEIKIASQIAKSRNIKFDKYVIDNYLFKKMDVVKDSVELFQYVDGTRQASILNSIEQHSDVVVGGHWGDVWLNNTGVSDENTNVFFEKKIKKKGSQWLLKEVCENYYPKHSSMLKNYYAYWSDKHKDIKNSDFRMKIFKTDQWSFRWTLPSIRVYQAAAFPVLPFYDNRIVDFFCKTNTELFHDRLFQIAYIKKYHSDLAKIKWQEYDSNLYNYKTFNNRHLGYRVYKKMMSTFSQSNIPRRNWEVFYLNETGKKKLTEIFSSKPFTEIIPINITNQLLEDFYENPDAANGYKVSMLHTLSQFVKNVF